MKKLLIAVGSAIALTALYISTNINGRKKDKQEIKVEDLNKKD